MQTCARVVLHEDVFAVVGYSPHIYQMETWAFIDIIVYMVLLSQIFKPNSVMTTFAASMIGGIVVTICMTPFDVVSTRLYNQPVNHLGRGVIYSGVLNCFWKIFRSEGWWGFYKGWGASYMRLGPHTTLGLVFWDEIRKLYNAWSNPVVASSSS